MFRRLQREVARRSRLAAAATLSPLAPAALGGPRGAWLFGAAVGRAFIDNSAALFRHVRRCRPFVSAYWTIDADAPDVAVARAVGPVLERESLAANLAALRAAVHVVSHGAHDVPGCASRLTRRALKVRLGHGLTALKRTRPRLGHTNKSANAIFDLVPVASDFERDNKRAWDIPDDALVVTGLPRFDDLVHKCRAPRAPGPRRVLYLPTWRDWVPQDARAGTREPFIATVLELLASRALSVALEQHDAILEVYLHRILHEYAAPLAARAHGGRVRVVPTEEHVQDVLAAADALLTDYSSVTWDALYVDKPVLFFPFDLERYQEERGAYLDLRTDLPGPSARTVEGVAHMLDEALGAGLPLSPQARRWQGRAFAYRDDGNCARVLTAIEARLRAA